MPRGAPSSKKTGSPLLENLHGETVTVTGALACQWKVLGSAGHPQGKCSPESVSDGIRISLLTQL